MHLRPGRLAQFLRVKQFCVNVLQFMVYVYGLWRIITHVLRPGGLAMEQNNWSLESLQGYRGLGAHTESEVVYLIYFWGIFWTFLG